MESLLHENNQVIGYEPFGNYALFNEVNNSNLYYDVKKKLLSYKRISTSELDESQIEIIKEKYKISDLKTSIDTFKKEVVSLYNKKAQLWNIYNNNKKKFESFAEKITQTVDSIHVITVDTEDDDDYTLVRILLSKIEAYYKLLDIDASYKEFSRVELELEYLYDSINSLLSIKHPCTCTVCLENTVEYFADPCGHTICSACKLKVSSNVCIYCRSNVNSFKKLYLLDV